ncbi:glycosyl transferase family 2 [Chryseobacterium sp. Leaf405]|uniref:glycosyltransferase family 2 protein n=1 Tax=Chryseobacterium sp. Leaf405 TaxID=1736367 RepID=UPI0006FF7FF9|nr:glycosyltransferase family 2 protein [Chryseobacterium sp. Leaf405]KQT24061.1 glycosyl transferase family 2 [Chryseobacterium sp. Leaf405]
MDCSIIIVNYNTKVITNNCIDSIISKTQDVKYEIILVDNGSTDGSKEHFEKRKDIRYIYVHENLGFGKANNLGSRYAIGEFLFLLNSDTILIENSVKILLDFFKINNNKLNIGVLGAILCDENLNKLNTAGSFPKVKFYISDYLNLFFKTRLNTYQEINFSNITKVDMVSGADMFLKRELFLQVNGFDEKFFLYFEETDLQKRIFNLSKVNYIINQTKIIHLEGASSKLNNWKRKVIQDSQTLYFRKNDSQNFLKYVFFELLCTPVRFLNSNYTIKENISFIKNNISKLYEYSNYRK